jgi:hypothetical protein
MWLEHEDRGCILPDCRAAERKRLQPAVDPCQRQIRVVLRTGLPRLAAWNGNPAAIPVTDLPHRAETLRESRLLQMYGVLVSGSRQPRAVEKRKVHRCEWMFDARTTRVSPDGRLIDR